MKPLRILWQRVVDADGATCPRCQRTLAAIERAMPELREALQPLGFEPVLESRAIDLATFQGATAESNRIWIEGRALEDWLGARVGHSPCCATCGDAECRTLEVGGASFDAIPAEFILRAALMAAAQAGGSPATASACCAGSRGCPG